MATALSVTQPAPACTEHELVAAVRRGSDRAFEELYARYRARIGSYVFGMVGDHARAEDISQEVFISALRRLRETERPIVLKPWLYEIAKNACIDEFRRTRRAAREVPLESDGEDSPGPVLAGGTTPDAAIENKQRLYNLRGAFHGLSENHHRILVMRELEGLSYSQIGTSLGMSRAEVESTLFRARRKLGEEYSELVSGRRCERVQSVIEAGGERPLRSLGLRDRRQLARHLAHCQPCRRHARMAGVDESFFQTPGLIGKIAALLPFPWLRWRRSHNDGEQVAASSGHQLAALQSLPVLARFVDGSTPMFGAGRATAAAAAVLIAGAGGGLVAGLGSHPPAPAHHVSIPAARMAPVVPPPAPMIHVTGASARSAAAPSHARAAKLSGGHGGGGGGSQVTSTSGGSASAGHSSGGSGSPLSKTVGSVSSTLNNLTSGAGGASNALGTVASGAQNTVNNVASGATNTVNNVASGATSTVNNVASGAGSTVNTVASGATNTVNKVTSGATGTVSNVASGATSTVNNVASGATGTLNKVTSSATQTLGSLTHP